MKQESYTDEEIVFLIKSGSEKKISKIITYLLNQYTGIVKSILKKKIMSWDEDFEKELLIDSVRELYFAIKRDKYQKKENIKLSTYFYKIVQYTLSNKLRKLKKDFVPIEEADNLGNLSEDSIESIVIKKEEEEEQKSKLADSLKKLSTKCQNILRLFYFEKLKLEKIAKKLGITLESARNRKWRCMQKLRESYITS